jgi:hypothetical protein
MHRISGSRSPAFASSTIFVTTTSVSKRMMLRVEQGKGGKDRFAMLSPHAPWSSYHQSRAMVLVSYPNRDGDPWRRQLRLPDIAGKAATSQTGHFRTPALQRTPTTRVALFHCNHRRDRLPNQREALKDATAGDRMRRREFIAGLRRRRRGRCAHGALRIPLMDGAISWIG